MKDKPKGGMRQKTQEHKDVQQDKKLVKKMVKKSCLR
jgi:hypothetical protein